ncbi:50S ribosomal protein L3 glutamine methyltransferase [Geodia barretti]|uniref:50S ribosomal protein L3 glutamine methyltransferase n=1 Tax=Geodia barretti TaxID=519541 RepID=A0AA35RGD5_GEOBA|nr:50S ribosomal protein L3 glutamine methyltransferase [Geodia barretti]
MGTATGDGVPSRGSVGSTDWKGESACNHGDLFEALDGLVDVVVSNPPYLSDDEVAELPPDVQREPTLALAAGVDGLDVLRRLIVGAWEYEPGGLLALEIDPRRLRGSDLARGTFGDSKVGIVKDHGGLDRVVTVGLG